VKYVPLPDKAYSLNREHLAKGKKGTVFGGKNEVGITISELLKREASQASAKRVWGEVHDDVVGGNPPPLTSPVPEHVRNIPPSATASDPIDAIGCSSKIGFHVLPPSMDFHTPPDAVAV